MQSIWLLVLTCALLYLGRKLLSFLKALQEIGYVKHPMVIKEVPLSTTPSGTTPGVVYSFHQPPFSATFYQKSDGLAWGGTICSSKNINVAILPTVEVTMVLADAAAIKEVTSSRVRFPKPVEQYGVLAFYGRNIVASEGEDWKKYRKISAPAFSDRNNKLVWDETINITQGLFNDLWKDQEVISVDHFLDITFPIALFVIGVAGFGRSVSWKEDIVPPGHTMSFKDTLHVITNDFILKLLLPGWALGLTPRLRKVRLAFEELYTYMVEMIQHRQAATEKVERHDLFSSLLEANDHDLDIASLSESELISNIYVFLVAGHETTAHTLCFTFALLALYPDEQEKLFEHIKSVTKGHAPTYAEMPLLTHSMAVFNETLRMFPPVRPSLRIYILSQAHDNPTSQATGIPKTSAEDTSLVAGNIHGEQTTVVIPKGTGLIIDTIGLHYNPRYWNDPHIFNPSRFLKDWPRDAFLPFSAGARACIGRKFAETEGIAVLTMFVSQFKITLKEEPQFAGETFEERKSRVLSARPGVTLTPVRVPLVFTRR